LGTAVGPLLGGLLYDQVGQAIPFYANAILLVVSALWAIVALHRSHGRPWTLSQIASVSLVWSLQAMLTRLRRIRMLGLRIRAYVMRRRQRA
jgi:MFS family permease